MSTATLPQRHEIPVEQTWNLGTIYATDAAWEQDFQRVSLMLPKIRQFEGRLGSSAQTLLDALTTRDAAGEVLGKLFVYATMRWHENTANSTYQALADRVNTLASDFGTASAFFTPEILAIPQVQLDGFLRQEPKLQVYRHALDEINRMRPHVLATEMEALLAQASEMGSGPERTYEMLTNADLKLPTITDENGQTVQITQGNYVSRFLESPNRELRHRAFEAMLGTYAAYRNTFAATLSGQVKTDLFFARSRRYDSALEAALDPNNIPASVYSSLIDTVHQNLPKLHRYLQLRKRLLGLDELHMYDLYVPMVREVEYKVPFQQAQEQVAQAVGPLGEEYVAALRKGFGSRWIDVPENQGKRSGAYSWGSYGTNPFVLLNYQGTMDSMFTLAHEMGHAMHSYFTWKTQPYPYGGYTLFVAEVASTLNEALLTDYLLKHTQDRALRMYILNHALETYRTTLYRQTLFAEFERETHQRAEKGESLTPELLASVFKGLNDHYYGPVVQVDQTIEYEWARIPHFYSSFYVYQYATGISASAALAHQILTEGEPAAKRYLRFLSSGSSNYSIDLLREAGVDLSSPQPVQEALNTFARYLDEMEQLAGAGGSNGSGAIGSGS
ncbi:MAG TPA: oligoendopeptidase F [Ktedonobacterales bacterium]